MLRHAHDCAPRGLRMRRAPDLRHHASRRRRNMSASTSPSPAPVLPRCRARRPPRAASGAPASSPSIDSPRRSSAARRGQARRRHSAPAGSHEQPRRHRHVSSGRPGAARGRRRRLSARWRSAPAHPTSTTCCASGHATLQKHCRPSGTHYADARQQCSQPSATSCLLAQRGPLVCAPATQSRSVMLDTPSSRCARLLDKSHKLGARPGSHRDRSPQPQPACACGDMLSMARHNCLQQPRRRRSIGRRQNALPNAARSAWRRSQARCVPEGSLRCLRSRRQTQG